MEYVHGGWMADRINDSRSSHSVLPVHFSRIQHGRERSPMESNEKAKDSSRSANK
jgi:hypothetical protein